MSNILKNYNIPIDLRLSYDEYWDFCLNTDIWSNGANTVKGLQTRCLISYININDPDCVWFDNLYSDSKYLWSDAINNGVKLNYIGFTGVDNGIINYRKDRISNEIFYKLFTNSSMEIDANDKRFHLKKVNGNNLIYDYSADIVFIDNKTCAKLNGGFYQGFFKLPDCKLYQVLPDKIEDTISFEFTLKMEDFDKQGMFTLNDKYPENKGMFFYLGTRAENKWWIRYKNDYIFNKATNLYFSDDYVNQNYEVNDTLNDGYFKPINDRYSNDYFADDYLSDKSISNCCYKITDETTSENSNFIFTMPEYLNTYKDNSLFTDGNGNILVHNEKLNSNEKNNGNYINKITEVCCGEYLSDKYVNDDYINNDNNCCDKYVKDEYYNDEMQINENEEFKTSHGYNFSQPNITEIKTDNKFITFHHGEGGFTINNWDKNAEYIISDIKIPEQENYFLLFNHTKNGYTIKNIDLYEKEQSKKYDVLDDIFKNALAFQIKDNGSIGYKYLVRDCETDNKWYKIETEFSHENIIKKHEWIIVHITISKIGHNKMKLLFYINGKLCLVSKELPMIDLKALNDLYDKQQSVPFNISLGGGTQGLCDVIYLNYRKIPEYVLPLEKEFAGSFVGYFASFKMYNCSLNLNEIIENYHFESKL